MSLKSHLKSVIPYPLWCVLREIKYYPESVISSFVQKRRFRRWISRENSFDKARVQTRLAFDVHRLEKGLSHKRFRYGFGIHTIEDLSRHMLVLERVDSNYFSNPLYIQGISVLSEYRKRHENAGYDLSKIQKIVPYHIWDAVDFDDTQVAGSSVLYAKSKVTNLQRNFIEIADNRHSVREYSAAPVSQVLLDKVYQVAMRTPSVCNRQSSRIYQICESNLIKQALDIQCGFRGYDIPPVLLLITSDIRAFLNENERNEPFVDGGLFCMSLLYALEAYGLAACPLNAMFSRSQDVRTRKLLGIPDYELPIMYIAIGNFPESVPICKSTRYTANSIVRTL